MDRRLRNRILIFLALAAVAAFILVRLSGRQPVAKISAVLPIRENLSSSVDSNGKVEPIAPFVVRAQLDTFVEKVQGVEGQQVKKGQLLLELNVKDAAAQLAVERMTRRARSVIWPRRRPNETSCRGITTRWKDWWPSKPPPKTNWQPT